MGTAGSYPSLPHQREGPSVTTSTTCSAPQRGRPELGRSVPKHCETAPRRRAIFRDRVHSDVTYSGNARCQPPRPATLSGRRKIAAPESEMCRACRPDTLHQRRPPCVGGCWGRASGRGIKRAKRRERSSEVRAVRPIFASAAFPLTKAGLLLRSLRFVSN